MAVHYGTLTKEPVKSDFAAAEAGLERDFADGWWKVRLRLAADEHNF